MNSDKNKQPDSPVAPAQISGTSAPLTPELLRTFPGCNHYTDDEALRIITTLKVFGELIFNFADTKNMYNIDYQIERKQTGKLISLNPDQSNKAA